MMQKIKNWFLSFMSGRYGMDKLNTVMMWCCIGIAVINIFLGSAILYFIQTALLIYTIFRMMSRNHSKRRVENNAFLSVFKKVKGFFTLQRDKFRDRKTHTYRKCPHCKAILRLPKLEGNHSVKCPRCSDRFDVKI